MPGSSNNNGSFIPKQGPARRKTKKGTNKFVIFTIFTYSLLFASLLAAGATFFYHTYVKSQLEQEAAGLAAAKTTFNSADLEMVQQFDLKLKRATDRIDNASSIVSVLDAVSQATVGPAQLQTLSIKRSGDTAFLLTGEVLTPSFDAAIFQRAIYKLNKDIFAQVEATDVSLARNFAQESLGSDANDIATEVTFTVELAVPLSVVPFVQQRVVDTDQLETTVQDEAPESELPETEGNLDQDNELDV